MWKTRITALIILILGIGVGYFVYKSEPRLNTNTAPTSWYAKFPFKLGLDLSGGTHLVYSADTSELDPSQVSESMNSLRDVIERRVNLFGVSEPNVQIQEGGIGSENQEKLIVDLPGVTDISEAIKQIGQTPVLEFKTEGLVSDGPQNATVGPDGNIVLEPKFDYVSTGLTGRYLEKATLVFDQTTREPIISLQFDDTGAELFAKITKENIGKTVAIFLDGAPISNPVVQQEITGGQAQITGTFSVQEAKMLVGRLNSGALPVPVKLISTQTIGPSLGEKAVHAGARAALFGFAIIALFLVLWYRLPGIVAVLALGIYVSIMLAIFKLLPVTLTAAGIAGFIISIGLAVDANVLIFERVKEELKRGKSVKDAMHTGFDRAWTSIRDANTSSLITAVILFWFGTSLIQGFALTFGLGVVVSLFSAITVTRLFLYALDVNSNSKVARFLFSSGLGK